MYSLDIEFPQWELQGDYVAAELTPVNVKAIRWIRSEDDMKQLIENIKDCKAIGMSVIQHSYRSYLGYCSVIMVGF